MPVYEYIVAKLDGDYAYLERTDAPEEELKCVARALLPEAIMEGTELRYEMLEYSVK
ncbi:MAG: chorismate--pyruvate lyase [Clostridium sp.]|nr:chorismate--pyruvate lyase [Clostridium sp.]